MYHPTTRVLTVLELLQSHGHISGPELARRLEVDTRTVRRYVTILQDLGIPIEAERGRYGSYGLRPGFKLPPLMFAEDEAVAVALGLLAARRMKLAVAAPAVEGAIAKVERVLPAKLREQVQAVQNTLVFNVPDPEAPPSSEIVLILSNAAQQRRRVHIGYRDFSGVESERDIEPYGLVYHSGRWYAVGYCHRNAGMRTFRIDRMLRAELGDERFERPDNFDSLAYLLKSLAAKPGTYPIEVLIHAPIRWVREDVDPTIASFEETPEGVVLRCEARDINWTARWLIAFGWPFEVRQCEELRIALRRLAEACLACAGPE